MALQPNDNTIDLDNSTEIQLRGEEVVIDQGGKKEEGGGAGGENVLETSSSSAPPPPPSAGTTISAVAHPSEVAPSPATTPATSSESPAASAPSPPPPSAPTSSSPSAPVAPPPPPPSSSSPSQPTSSSLPSDDSIQPAAPSGPPSLSAPSPVPSPSFPPPPASTSTPPIPTSSTSSLHFTHPIKKFTAVSVNKKFLSNTTSGGAASSSSMSSTAASAPSSTLKSTLSTSSTSKLPPLQPPSRLLTTKLVHPTPRVVAPAPAHAGWARPTPSPGAVPSKLPLSGPGATAGGSLFKSRGGDSFSWGPGPAGAAGGDRRGAGGAGGPGGLRSQFPTTAESAEERRVNAQAAKQAAAAKSQAVLLELDAFRGVHLDPNAHHWDDVDDEDDDFLDDVVEFGDGTQYTIDHTQPPPEVEQEEEPSSNEKEQQRYPPANDFDRSWPQKQGGGPPSQHPHPPSSRAPPPHQRSTYQSSSSPSSEHYLHQAPPSQPHLARPPPSSAHLPSKPRAGEDPSRVLFNARSNQFEPPSSGKSGPPQGPGGRRPSNDRQPIRGFDRPPPPHVELQRSLPPHLEQGRGGPPPAPAAAAPVPQPAPPPSRTAWGVPRENSRAAAGVGLGGLSSPPTVVNKDFPPPSALSANRSALPPQTNAFATSASLPPAAPRSARVSFSTPTPPAARPPSSVGSPETALHHLPHPSLALRRTSTEHGGGPTPTQVIEDVSAMQKDEMHSAAHRAKLRRQKEEEERQAAMERARAKAKALEEKFAPKEVVVEEKKTEEKEEKKEVPVASSPTPVPTSVAAPSTPVPAAPSPSTSAPMPAPVSSQSTANSSGQGTPARQWKLNGNLLPAAGMDTPRPPKILKGEPIPNDVQVIDFANLGSLVASQSSSSRAQTPQPSPTKSRRPVATDFFDAPSSPSRPSPTPFSSLPAKVESSNTTSGMTKSPSVSSQLVEQQQHSLPPRPPPAESSSSPSPFAQPPTPSPPPATEVRSSSKGPPSPTKQAFHHQVELSSFDATMARIKGAMGPQGTPTGLSAPPSPTKSSTPRPLPPPEPESDQTKPDRPTSPVLAWKVYPVRLPSSSLTRRPPIDSRQVKLFNRVFEAIKVVDPVSWEPPLGKTPAARAASRDEMLHVGARKVLKNGSLAAPSVYLPSRRGWERLRVKAGVAAARLAKAAAAVASSSTPTTTTKLSPSLPVASPLKPTFRTPSPSPTPPSNPSTTTVLPPPPSPSPAPTPSPNPNLNTSLPTRPVPSLAVIPPTPLRPLKPSRAMEESSWRRRTPVPEVVVAEEEKAGGEAKEEGVESIAIGETTEGGMVMLNRSVKGVEVRIQARQKVQDEVVAPVVVVQEVEKVEEKLTPVPTVQLQKSEQQPPTVDLASPSSDASPRPSKSALKLPEGSDVGFYRDRSPSIGTVSQEQLEPLVRFMVTSEIDSFQAEELGPKSTDPGVEEDVPEFASIMRSPSSSGGDLARTESSTSIPRLPTNMSGVVLSPPSAATSSAWSKSVPKVDREQQVRDVWSSSPSSSSADPSRNVGGPFPSSLHFSSPDLHTQGGHQNNSGSIRSFAGGPGNNNSSRGQFPPPPQQQQQRNFVGGGQQQPQGFPSPYSSISRPNGASQPNSPAMYPSSFNVNSGSPHPNPSAPAFLPNPQLGRNPPSLNPAIPHRPSFSAYPSSLSMSSSSSSSQGHQQQPGGGGGASMMYSSHQPTLNPASQPFQMRPGAAGVPIIGSPSPLVGLPGSLPPPFAATPQGVWLPVVPVPPLRPNQQQGSYSGLSSPSPAFSSPSLHQPSPYSSHNSLPSPNHNHFGNSNNSSPNLPPHAPTYRNLSDFSSSPSSSFSSSMGMGGRQAPPHQPQNQHGMFSSNGRGGPMDNHARGGSNSSSQSNSGSNAPHQQQQPIYASIGGPQGGGGGSYGSGGYGSGGAGGGGNGRRSGW